MTLQKDIDILHGWSINSNSLFIYFNYTVPIINPFLSALANEELPPSVPASVGWFYKLVVLKADKWE